MGKVTVNKKGLNCLIQARLLSDAEMRAVGFTDHNKQVWYYCRQVYNRKGIDISFAVSIPKANMLELEIDVLDEDFLQPYDYQTILEQNPEFPIALEVKENIEKQMEYLQQRGVLSGHVKGAYI